MYLPNKQRGRTFWASASTSYTHYLSLTCQRFAVRIIISGIVRKESRALWMRMSKMKELSFES